MRAIRLSGSMRGGEWFEPPGTNHSLPTLPAQGLVAWLVFVFCVELFPENGCRFSLDDGGSDPIISGPSVGQEWLHAFSDLCVVSRLCGATFSSVAPSFRHRRDRAKTQRSPNAEPK